METKFFVRYCMNDHELRDEAGPFDNRTAALTYAASMIVLRGPGSFKMVDVVDRDCWIGRDA